MAEARIQLEPRAGYRFTAEIAAEWVGTSLPIEYRERLIALMPGEVSEYLGEATITAASVEDDGELLELTLSIDDHLAAVWKFHEPIGPVP